MPVISLKGKCWFFLFKDEATWYQNVYVMKTASKLKEFERSINNKFQKLMKVVWLDNRREYINEQIQGDARQLEIRIEPLAPYALGRREGQQDGRQGSVDDNVGVRHPAVSVAIHNQYDVSRAELALVNQSARLHSI